MSPRQSAFPDMLHPVEPADSQLETERPSRSETRTLKPKRLRVATLSLAELQNELAHELGEQSIIFKARGWGWARKQIQQGQCVARYAWRLHDRPKPLFLWLRGCGKAELLLMRTEAGQDVPAQLSWADLNECDWHRVTQLELAR
jgi:hypothetical protein